MTFLPIKPIFSRCTNEKQRQPTNKTIENRAKVLRPWLYYCLYRKYISYNIQSSYLRVLVRREGFEPPAFWSVGCLKGKSEPFRLRFVVFTTVRSANLPLFPSSPARFFRILGQKWVKHGALAPIPTASRRPSRRRRQQDRPRRPHRSCSPAEYR